MTKIVPNSRLNNYKLCYTKYIFVCIYKKLYLLSFKIIQFLCEPAKKKMKRTIPPVKRRMSDVKGRNVVCQRVMRQPVRREGRHLAR